jgi:hypothetical protein
MKNTFLFIAFICSILFASCENNNTSTNAASVIVNGNWRVSLYSENGIVKTTDFSGYTFTFNANGTIQVNKAGLATVNGTWSKGNDDSKEKIIINFGTISLFDELNEDWEVVENTNTSIKLQHISGGNGTTDILHFEKN